jgi:hypothetical protein
MNTNVREMNPAEEIELTDAQLMAVYGACDGEDEDEGEDECDDRSQYRGRSRLVRWNVWPGLQSWDQACEPRSQISIAKTVHQKSTFSFSKSIQREENVDQSERYIR